MVRGSCYKIHMYDTIKGHYDTLQGFFNDEMAISAYDMKYTLPVFNVLQ